MRHQSLDAGSMDHLNRDHNMPVDIESRLSRVEATLDILPRLEEKMDRVVEVAAAVRNVEMRQDAQHSDIDDIERSLSAFGERIGNVESEIKAKVAWVRGAMVAATAFWVLLQGAIGIALHNTLEIVHRDHEAIVRMDAMGNRLGWPTTIQPKE